MHDEWRIIPINPLKRCECTESNSVAILLSLIHSFIVLHLRKHSLEPLLRAKMAAVNGKTVVSVHGKMVVSMHGKMVVSMHGKMAVSVQGKMVVSVHGKMVVSVAGKMVFSVHGKMAVSVHGKMVVSVHGKMVVSVHGKMVVSVHGKMAVSVHGKMAVSVHGKMVVSVHDKMVVSVHDKMAEVHGMATAKKKLLKAKINAQWRNGCLSIAPLGFNDAWRELVKWEKNQFTWCSNVCDGCIRCSYSFRW